MQANEDKEVHVAPQTPHNFDTQDYNVQIENLQKSTLTRLEGSQPHPVKDQSIALYCIRLMQRKFL